MVDGLKEEEQQRGDVRKMECVWDGFACRQMRHLNSGRISLLKRGQLQHLFLFLEFEIIVKNGYILIDVTQLQISNNLVMQPWFCCFFLAMFAHRRTQMDRVCFTELCFFRTKSFQVKHNVVGELDFTSNSDRGCRNSQNIYYGKRISNYCCHQIVNDNQFIEGHIYSNS